MADGRAIDRHYFYDSVQTIKRSSQSRAFSSDVARGL
jgi:hypothetical protein